MEYTKKVLEWLQDNSARFDEEEPDTILDELFNNNGPCQALDQITSFLTEVVDILETPAIVSADLLPIKRVADIPEEFYDYSLGNEWWVDGPITRDGIPGYACSVDECGSLHLAPSRKRRAVRPAVKVANTPISLYFNFKEHAFRMIDEDTALCITDITPGGCPFNEFKTYDNDYEHSYVKQCIDKWFKE